MMYRPRTLLLGLSGRCIANGYNGVLVIVWFAILITALAARCVDGFAYQRKQQLMKCPRILHHKRHRQVVSHQTIYSMRRQNQICLSAIDEICGTVTILVPSPSSSGPSKFVVSKGDPPLSYLDAAKAVADKVSSISSNTIDVSVETVLLSSASSPSDVATTRQKASNADVLLGLGLSSPSDLRYLSTPFRERRLSDINNSNQWSRCSKRCQFALDCAKPFAPIVGLYDEANPNFLCKIPWAEEAKGRETMYEMMDMFEEWNLKDFANAIVIFFERFG